MRVALEGDAKGDEEIEYCLTLIGGRSERNVPKGREMEGYLSRMSSNDSREVMMVEV